MTKILIIRFSSIGDIVLTTPIIRTVHKQLNAEVHFLTKNSFKTIVQHNPYISKIYTIDKKISEVVTALKKEKYDYIIDLHKNIRSQKLKFALGVKSFSFSKLNFQKWLKVRVNLDLLPAKHIVDRYFEGIADIGVSNDGQGLDYFISDADMDLAYDIIKAIKHYNVLVLGANYFTKRIPISLSTKIIAQSQYPVILLGGHDVESEAEELSQLFPAKTLDYVGKTSLAISAGIIRKANEVHTGDTGLMHIAAAYSKKVITYWGNTIPEFGMYAYLSAHAPQRIDYEIQGLSCRPCSKLGFDSCPKGHFKCMLDIEPGKIVD